MLEFWDFIFFNFRTLEFETMFPLIPLYYVDFSSLHRTTSGLFIIGEQGRQIHHSVLLVLVR